MALLIRNPTQLDSILEPVELCRGHEFAPVVTANIARDAARQHQV